MYYCFKSSNTTGRAIPVASTATKAGSLVVLIYFVRRIWFQIGRRTRRLNTSKRYSESNSYTIQVVLYHKHKEVRYSEFETDERDGQPEETVQYSDSRLEETTGRDETGRDNQKRHPPLEDKIRVPTG